MSHKFSIDYIGYNYSAIDPRCEVVDPLNRTRPNARPFVRDFSYFLVVLTLIYIITSISRFYYYRKQYVRLQKRSFLMIVVAGAGALCQVLGNSLWLATDYICWVKVVLFMFVVPFLTMSLPIRMLDFYNRHVFARRLLLALKENAEQVNAAYAKAQETNRKGSEDVEIAIVSMQNQSSETKIAGTSVRSLKMLKFLTSVYMKLILIFLMLLPNLASLFHDFASTPYLDPDAQCRGCYLSRTTVYVLLIGGAGMSILGIFLVLIARKYPDPFGLLPEVVYASIFGGVVAVVGFILDNIFTSLTHFTFGWIILLGCVIILFIVTDFQVYLAKTYDTPIREKASSSAQNDSVVNRESALPTTDGATVVPELVVDDKLTASKLKKLLENRIIVEYFEEHLVAEFSVELIRMYMECQTFRSTFMDLTERTRKARAKRIVETYVVDTALSQVNLSDALRTKIINDVHSEAPVSFEIFRESDGEILRIMLGAYQRFMKTKGYEEMALKIQEQIQRQGSKLKLTKSEQMVKGDSKTLGAWAT